MTRRSQLWIVGAGVVVMLVVLAGAFSAERTKLAALRVRPDGPQALTAISDELASRLEQQVIPSFDVDSDLNEDMLKRLNEFLAEHTQPRPVRLAVWTGRQPPEGFHRERPPTVGAKSSAGLERAGEDRSVEAPRSLAGERTKFADIPFNLLLKYVARASECSIGQQGDTLYLVKGKGIFGPLVEKTITNPGFVALWPHPPPIEDFLQSSGVTFYEGTMAEVTPAGKLRFRNVQDQVDLCEAILGGSPQPTIYEQVKYWWRERWEDLRHLSP